MHAKKLMILLCLGNERRTFGQIKGDASGELAGN